MVQFFFGILRTKSEPIGEEKSKQERDEWFPTRTEQSFYDYSNFTNFWTVHWQNVSFQDKVKIKQISFGISVEHPPKKHGPKQPWGIYSSENGLKFFFALVEEIWGPVYFGQGY